jgi:hypothetical protein
VPQRAIAGGIAFRASDTDVIDEPSQVRLDSIRGHLPRHLHERVEVGVERHDAAPIIKPLRLEQLRTTGTKYVPHSRENLLPLFPCNGSEAIAALRLPRPRALRPRPRCFSTRRHHYRWARHNR